MPRFKLHQRDLVEVYPGENEFVWIRQETRDKEQSLIAIHVLDVDQLVEFLTTAKKEILRGLSHQKG